MGAAVVEEVVPPPPVPVPAVVCGTSVPPGARQGLAFLVNTMGTATDAASTPIVTMSTNTTNTPPPAMSNPPKVFPFFCLATVCSVEGR